MRAFGAYLMQRTFDEAMWSVELILDGEPAAPENQRLKARLSGLSPDERQAAKKLARDGVIVALHGLSHDEERIRLLFDGLDVATSSDGLQGDLFTWLRELSRYPDSPPEADLDLENSDYGFESPDEP